MTPISPDLNCSNCGDVGTDYTVSIKGDHHQANCNKCGAYIKNLSKPDKYGTKEQQREIWNKTGGLCCYCGCALNPFKKNGYTYEHINPQANGGGHDEENLFPCCKSCNSQKGPKTLKEYREYMAKKEGKKTRVFHFEVLEYGPNHISDILKKLTINP